MKKILAIALTIFLLMSLRTFGEDAPADTLQTANAFYQKYLELNSAGKYEQAIPYAKKSLELFEKTLGKEHSNVATSLSNLAGLYRKTARNAES